MNVTVVPDQLGLLGRGRTVLELCLGVDGPQERQSGRGIGHGDVLMQLLQSGQLGIVEQCMRFACEFVGD